MSEFINTIDVLGDDVVTDGIIAKTIAEFHDDTLSALHLGAFHSCKLLTIVNLPALKTTAGDTFAECTALKKADFNIIDKINSSEFKNCSSLDTLIIRRADKICNIYDYNTFQNTPIKKGTGYIYVPRALVDSYKATSHWSTYANQIRAIEDYPDICG